MPQSQLVPTGIGGTRSGECAAIGRPRLIADFGTPIAVHERVAATVACQILAADSECLGERYCQAPGPCGPVP